MQTYSLNSLAESFEVDRSTMVRALRGVAPDVENTKGRPQWKIATAARALEDHRRRNGRAHGTGETSRQDPELVRLYAKLDAADAVMRKLPTLDARRKAAIAMIPLIACVDQATRQHGKINGGDPDTVDMRADVLYTMQLRGLETCCGWSMGETWSAMAERQQ